MKNFDSGRVKSTRFDDGPFNGQSNRIDFTNHGSNQYGQKK